MKIYEQKQREIERAAGAVDSLGIGYSNICGDGPSLSVRLPHTNDGQPDRRVSISFRDLAHLVRAADEYAKHNGVPDTLKDWRELT